MEKYLQKDREKKEIIKRQKKEKEHFENLVEKLVEKYRAQLESIHKKELENAEKEVQKEYKAIDKARKNK